MIRSLSIAACLASLALTTAARADPEITTVKPAWPTDISAHGPRNSVSFYPFAFAAPGFAIEYERFVSPRRWSFAAGFGYKSAAGGDYRSRTLTPSLELRYWLIGRGPFSELANRGMVGPYLSLREAVAFTSTTDEVRDHIAGTALEIVDVVSFGYRITVGPVAITPSHGASVSTQIDPSGRLAPTTTVAARFALSLGVLF